MSPQIILIEDDTELRDSLLEYLDLAGLNVTGVGSAIEFYQALNISSFDVAIIDVGLPDQSGYEVTEYIRDNTPMGTIILTARSSSEDKVQGYNSGADLYFVKPVDCQELVAAIRNLISRLASLNQRPKQLQTTEWVMDQTDWTLTGPNGPPIKLTSKEITFLEVLISQNGRTVKRDSLMKALGYDQDQFDSRALDALILRLRKKIEAEYADNDPIKTAHAVGYCFSAPVRVEQSIIEQETP